MQRSAWLASALVFLLLLSACTGRAPNDRDTSSAPPRAPDTSGTGSAAPSTDPPSEPPSSPRGTDLAALTSSFAALEKSTGADLGLAIAPVGGGPTQQLGEIDGGPAWSTAKVPLARAALGRNDDEDIRALVRRALRNSDNAAAEALWSELGDDATAAGRVTAVLRQTGDRSTTVPAKRKRAGFSIVGQTSWALRAQASYGGHLACLPSKDPVRDNLRHVRADLRWGLGRLDRAEFKGGWGPDDRGRYLVRQFGTVQLSDGQPVGIAIAAITHDGSYASGTRALDEVAAWVEEHVDQAPAAGPC